MDTLLRQALPAAVVQIVADYSDRPSYTFDFRGRTVQGRLDPQRPGVITFEIDKPPGTHGTPEEQVAQFREDIGWPPGPGLTVGVTDDTFTCNLDLGALRDDQIPPGIRTLAEDARLQRRVAQWLGI